MPLPSSGQISLDEMHVEAGGTTQTQSSLNDSAIRGLINKGAGVQMSFNEWYGAAGSLYSDTINAWGSYLFGTSPSSFIRGNTCGYAQRGVWGTGSYPSLTIGGTSTVIPELNYTAWGTGPAQYHLWFSAIGSGNTGWTLNTFDNNTLSSPVTFTRTSATYQSRVYNNCSNYHRYTWNPTNITNTSGNRCTPMGHSTTSSTNAGLSNIITTWTLE